MPLPSVAEPSGIPARALHPSRSGRPAPAKAAAAHGDAAQPNGQAQGAADAAAEPGVDDLSTLALDLQDPAWSQAAHDILDSADALADRIPHTQDPAEIDALALRAHQLRTRAAELVVAQIRWLAGQAHVSAVQVQAATATARDRMQRVAQIRWQLETATRLLAFVAAVLSGSGNATWAAARALRHQLDKPPEGD